MCPYEILKRVGKDSYEMKHPSELASVCLVLHISMLNKCIVDPEFILPIESVDVKDNLSSEEGPIKIHDRQVKNIRNKEVVSVKVL